MRTMQPVQVVEHNDLVMSEEVGMTLGHADEKYAVTRSIINPLVFFVRGENVSLMVDLQSAFTASVDEFLKAR